MFHDHDQSCCSPYVVGGRDVDGGVGVRNGGKFSFYWLVVRPSLLVVAPFINIIGESTLACVARSSHSTDLNVYRCAGVVRECGSQYMYNIVYI